MKNEELIANRERMDDGFVTVGLDLMFSYAAGEAASRFLIALRDEKKIYGTRCPECRRVLVPARSFCSRCFAEMSEWVEVGPQGILVAFTPFLQPFIAEKGGAYSILQNKERSEGKIFALIRLDGADTNFLHVLDNQAFDSLSIGMRVEAVFAEKRSGSILDIACFQPIGLPQRGQRANSE